MSEQLAQEIVQLKQQADQSIAQLEAHKQMLNENLQMNVNLRANIFLIAKENQLLNQKLAVANAEIATLSVPKPE